MLPGKVVMELGAWLWIVILGPIILMGYLYDRRQKRRNAYTRDSAWFFDHRRNSWGSGSSGGYGAGGSCGGGGS